MIKKISELLIIAVFSLCLTSCWDYEDVDKKCITISIGVDQVGENVQFSGEIANLTPSPEAKEKAQTGNVYRLLSYGKTFEEARIHYDAINPFPVFLGVTRVVVFGQNFAKKGIEPYLNRIGHIYDYRKTLLTVVSRESPTELFDTKVEKHISVGFLIEDIINSLSNTGKALYPTCGELLSDIALEEVGYLLPYIGKEKGSIAYLGLAVMKDSKLIGVIDIVDTDGILYLLGENPMLVEAIHNPENKGNVYSFRTNVKKRKIKTNYTNGKIAINIDLDLQAILRYQYYSTPISDEEIKRLEKIISEEVKSSIVSAIKKAQNEFQCDYFGFAKYFRADYPKVYRKIKWEEIFKDVDVKVQVKTKIVNENLVDPDAKNKY
ncbi:Ger(x)C family spore germination protein [Crassaminicella profunda]|uniref:Ger(x)C family spore germination protein n=1 Tax=Crassaminicella profunda TaxID=1286698 RepID=UPI001CA690A5|nr:Ger(x)C family spore germination protein [Crassaminicella profunda]QZY54882.1 Ger(x)C family spore germination protein [Crassaminicella profunda]